MYYPTPLSQKNDEAYERFIAGLAVIGINSDDLDSDSDSDSTERREIVAGRTA